MANRHIEEFGVLMDTGLPELGVINFTKTKHSGENNQVQFIYKTNLNDFQTYAQYGTEEKPGRCPSPYLRRLCFCASQHSECDDDYDCPESE